MAPKLPQTGIGKLSPAEILKEAVNRGISKRLKELGFRKKGYIFLKRDQLVVQKIELMTWHGHDNESIGFNLIIGVHFLEPTDSNRQVSNPQFHFQCGGFGEKNGHCAVTSKSDIDSLSQNLVQTVTTECLSQLVKYSDMRTAADALATADGNRIQAARLYLRLNERDTALKVLQTEIIEQRGKNDHRVSFVKRTAKELELDLPDLQDGPLWGVEGEYWYTEEAWNKCENPSHIFKILERTKAADSRLYRLAGVHMIRESAKLKDTYQGTLSFEQSQALFAAERYAEGVITQSEMQSKIAEIESNDRLSFSCHRITHSQAIHAAQSAIPVNNSLQLWFHNGPVYLNRDISQVNKIRNHYKPTIAILRDLFGNPFRPVTLDPSLRKESVMSLATSIYKSRDYSQSPILADLLEEYGCDSQELLNHLRSQQRHYLGCWALDTVLGKRKK